VIGDGRSTLRELVAAKNVLRSQNPSVFKYPIILDDHRVERLRAVGFEVDDIVPDKVEVIIDLKAGISSGAESADITDEVHSTFKDIAVRAMTAIPGLDIAGIDIIASDLAQPARRQRYIICEVNTGPGIGSHHFPMAGHARDAAGAIADLHLQWPDGPSPLTVGRGRAKQLRNIRRGIPTQSPLALGEHTLYDPSAKLIADEWSARGTEVIWLTPEFFVAEFRGHLLGYLGTATHTTGRAAVRAATDKALSRLLLTGAQLPVATGRVFKAGAGKKAAAAFAHSLGTAVVKPVNGRFGTGVTVGITSREEFDDAWPRAASASRGRVLAEQHFSGCEAGFLVVNGSSVAANYGGTDLTDRVHGSYHRAAEQAADAFPGLDIARVDIIAKDLRKPAEPDNYIICELDARPNIVPFQIPDTGQPQNVAQAIVDMHSVDQDRLIGGRTIIRRLLAGR
jgi:D-alanine-D-alanine ligase-like ATP-grasp enzyme